MGISFEASARYTTDLSVTWIVASNRGYNCLETKAEIPPFLFDGFSHSC
jgi:hypothetical protein